MEDRHEKPLYESPPLGGLQRIVVGILGAVLIVLAWIYPFFHLGYEWLSVGSLILGVLLSYLAFTGQSLAEVGSTGVKLNEMRSELKKEIKRTAEESKDEIERLFDSLQKSAELTASDLEFASAGRDVLGALEQDNHLTVDPSAPMFDPRLQTVTSNNSVTIAQRGQVGVEFIRAIAADETGQLGEMVERYSRSGLPLLIVTASQTPKSLVQNHNRKVSFLQVVDFASETAAKDLLNAIQEVLTSSVDDITDAKT